MATEEEIQRTLEQRWADIEPNAETIRQRPRETIRPRQLGPDTAGRRAMEALRQVAVEGGAMGPVTLERTLGEGGMGIVRLATQVTMGRQVAVKTLRPEFRAEAHVMKLLQEAWVTGHLEHPNILPVYDVGFDEEGSPRIVLKKIEGEPWSELMHSEEVVRDRFGVRDLLEWNLRILMQACNAIHFAHSRGVIHRDLKPDNVMIGEFGEVYVLDWGIAVSLRDDESGRLPLAKDALEMAGTPAYMAPEMLGGPESNLSERTDVYLLGAILYELITGQAPHRGDNAMEVVHAIASSIPPYPDDVPAELTRICRRAMDRDPDARFETAEQLRLALSGFLQHRGSMQLVLEADERLKELTSLVERAREAKVDDESREGIYHLFGECRFGFQQALSQWADNEAAREGRLRALTLMVEHELGQNDARAAARLLAEIEAPPSELRARVDKAVAEHERQRERVAELERIGAEHDAGIGARTRTFLTVILGTVWTVAPLVLAKVHSLVENTTNYPHMFAFTGVLLLMVAVLGFWARESMLRTSINRTYLSAIVVALTAQLVNIAGSWALGLDPVISLTLDFLIWFTVVTLTAAASDWRMLPSAFGYLVGFGLCIWRPEWRYYLMAACNLILTVNLVRLWRPLFQVWAWPRGRNGVRADPTDES